MNRTALLLAAAFTATGCAMGGPMTDFSRPAATHGEMALDSIAPEPVDMPVGTGPAAGGAEPAVCPAGKAPEGTHAGTWAALVEGCHTFQALDQDTYVYVVQRSFFGPPELQRPVAVEVEEGRVVRATDLETREDLDPAAHGPMEDVFFELTQIAEQAPHALTVELEAGTGVPTFTSVDWHEAAMDDWMQLQVELVRPEALDGAN